MSNSFSFRFPATTILRSPTFGIPRGTFERGDFDTPVAIVLHTLRVSLQSYDAQETNTFERNLAEPRHPSVHFAIDYAGNCHQYVEVADVAWGVLDYSRTSFPSPFPQGDWELLDTYPSVSPDYYSIHIAAVSGESTENGESQTAFTSAMLLTHARLIAWLCHTYEIDCDADHVTTHEHVDTQFTGVCAGADYPYAQIMAAAQAIITAGGESPDPIFNPPPILEEYFGIFTVGKSRIGGRAYIRTA